MKKAIIGMALMLLAAGCTANTNSAPPATAGDGNVQNSAPQPVTQPYRNLPYNFEFSYPTDFLFTTPTYANLAEGIVQIQLPQSAYPNTNFGDAGFAVSVGSAKTLSECLRQPAQEGNQGFKDTRTVNGVTFYQGTDTGAAAGNLYESRLYRTLRGSMCFEVAETVHTANIGNFPAGTVTEVDKDAVWKRLDDILATFKFTK